MKPISQNPGSPNPVAPCKAYAVVVTAVLLWAAILIAASSAAQADGKHNMVRIGMLSQLSRDDNSVKVFSERLRELGYREGENVVIEVRWADGVIYRLPALMAQLLQLKVDVIVAGATPSAVAAKNATSTVPIVGVAIGDPVRSRLAASLSHPGGNVTGLSMGYSEGLAGKWLEVLQEIVPRLASLAMVTNPDNPWERDRITELEKLCSKRGVTLKVIEVRKAESIQSGFEDARRETQAVLVIGNALTITHKKEITTLAAKLRLPAIYGTREFIEAGGLVAYAADWLSQYRRAADYVDRIIKGANPADLPFEQPTKFQLVVNLKTAKALGITIPESILLRADEVIR